MGNALHSKVGIRCCFLVQKWDTLNEPYFAHFVYFSSETVSMILELGQSLDYQRFLQLIENIRNRTHNPKVAGSNPVPATIKIKWLQVKSL
jgi:hypothetical protein